MDKLIETIDLTKIYGEKETAVTALNSINTTFNQNQFTAIMGPSGSGKSTLLHCLAGLDKASSGSILIKGVDLASLNDKQLTKMRRDSFGFIFQAFNLIPTLTAEENITLPSSVAGRKPDQSWVEEIINTMDIGDRLTHRPNELSGGQQQRVAIARALAMRPKVMLLDEITSALDPEVVGEVLNVIRSLNKEHSLTMIMVTHQMGFAREISDRVCFFNEGKIFEQGPPEKLFGDPQNERTKQFLHAVLDAN